MNYLKRNAYALLFALVATALLAVAIVIGATLKTDNTRLGFTGVRDYNSGWSMLADGNETELDEVKRPGGNDNKGAYVITRVLDEEIIEDAAILLESKNEIVRAYVDGELIYEYGVDNSQFYFGELGAINNLIDLPSDADGRRLTIEFIPTSEGRTGYTDYNVRLGCRNDLIITLIGDSLFILLVCAIMAIGAILMIGTWLVGIIKGTELSAAPLFFGIFVLLATVWTFSDSLLWQFFTTNKAWSYLIFNFSFILMPIPFLLFCAETFNRYRKQYLSLAAVFMGYAVLRTALYFAGIVNFEFALSVLHLMEGFMIIYTLTVCFKERKHDFNTYFFVALIVLAITNIASLFVFYIKDSLNNLRCGYSTGFYIGIILFAIIYIVGLYRRNQAMINQAMKAEFYEQSAFTDRLTKLANRAAFEQTMDEIDKNRKNYGSICVIVTDLNNLKLTNDTYGHYIGDELIVSYCKALRNAFAGIGDVFRTGGDEAAVVIVDKTRKEIGSYIRNELANEVKVHNNSSDIKLDFALGLCFKDDVDELNAREIYRTADEEMYKDKKQNRNKTD